MWLRSLLSARSLRRAAVAIAAVGAWSSANAALYTGVWDPPYGSPFGTLTSGLGWRGSATYYVPDTCELGGSGLVDNYGNLPFIPGSCGGQAAVTSAVVHLYDVYAGPANTLATLNFNPSSFYVGVLQYVGGELEGLISDFSNLLTPASDPGATPAELTTLDSFGPLNPYTTQFSLIFTLDGPRLAWIDCGYSESYRTSTNSHRTHCNGGINSNAPGFQPEFTITRVPEPGTLALASLALLMLLPRRARERLLQRR